MRRFIVLALVALALAACNDSANGGPADADSGADVLDADAGADVAADVPDGADAADTADAADGADADEDVIACPDDDDDGVCNVDDVCEGSDDGEDADSDGVPDGCDVCAGSDDGEDADSDGVPDGCDVCAGFDDALDTDSDGIPNGCDTCDGADVDTDEDGVADACDVCEGSDDGVDSDSDGVPDGCDVCADSDDTVDTDADEVPDGCDVCEGSDDGVDSDSDGVPDGCDVCADSDDRVDTDEDGVPDGCDACEGSDDADDSDSDGVPDDCDVCSGEDDTADADEDGVPDGCDICAGFDDAVHSDDDGVPDGCDNCPTVANAGQEDLEVRPEIRVESIAFSYRPTPETRILVGVGDNSETVSLGFDFQLFGGGDGNIRVHTDGTILFGTAPGSYGSGITLDTGTRNDYVAGFMTELNPTQGDGSVYAEMQGEAPNREFVIEWVDVPVTNRTETVNMQIVVGENRTVEAHCRDCRVHTGDQVLQGFVHGGLSASLPGRFVVTEDLVEDGVRWTLGDFEYTDGVGDACDVCRGDDSTGDEDEDGVCDDLDRCVGPEVGRDGDQDGICAEDACFGDNGSGDADEDGVCDDADACFGANGRRDTDSDLVCDDRDVCAGEDDTIDGDEDGTPDCVDECPEDGGKTEPGVCGCGVADTDSDGDGAADCIDVCPGFDDAGADEDRDGIPDPCDLSCPYDDLDAADVEISACSGSTDALSSVCARTTDGDVRTGFNYGDSRPPLWIQYDLGTSQTIDGLRYRTDWWNKAPDHFEVWTSESTDATPDSGATLVHEGTGGRHPQGVDGNPNDQTFVFDASSTGRYWYLRVLDYLYAPASSLVMFEVDFLQIAGCTTACDVDTDEDGVVDCYEIQPGDLTINEIMKDPEAVDDANGEWFELVNPTDGTLRVWDAVVTDATGTESFTIDELVIPAGGYAVVGTNADTETNGGAEVDFAYGDAMTFDADDDAIVVTVGGVEVDRVAWNVSDPWPNTPGASIAFVGDPTVPDENAAAGSWCNESQSYGSGDLGTPGAVNSTCD